MEKLLTIGFVKSEKPYEKRIAVLPNDLKKIKHQDCMYFEKGYGSDFLIEDEEYENLGCHVVDKESVLQQNIICDTKIGEATYLQDLQEGSVIFGWIHAAANESLTQVLLKKKMTCYAWEDMYENQRHIFYQNNQIAGAGGVLNAISYAGFLPYGCQAGIIGRGDTAMGAYRILASLGASVKIYNRHQEKLFQKELPELDIVVMAVRWDTLRDDYLISTDDFKRMKKLALLIDVSDDEDGAIEKSHSTTIHDPIYEREGRKVYSVGNIPSVFYITATQGISKVVAPYLDILIEQRSNDVLKHALIIDKGQIIDQHIDDFHKKHPQNQNKLS